MEDLKSLAEEYDSLEINSRSLYIDLVSKCVLDEIYGHRELVPVIPHGLIRKVLIHILSKRGIQLVREKPIDPTKRLEGYDWPSIAQSMIGRKRMDNVRFCVEDALNRGVPGDFIEAGVWRGGVTILMRAILKAYGITNRIVWVADSFRGLPPPDVNQPQDEGDVHHTFDELAISLEEVKANFDRYGLLDEQVRFLKGWFKDTLPVAPIDELAVIRLDGDMYGSIMDSLNALYHKLSPGGYLIVDDYKNISSCRAAITDFRRNHQVRDDIVEIDWSAVYWKKSR